MSSLIVLLIIICAIVISFWLSRTYAKAGSLESKSGKRYNYSVRHAHKLTYIEFILPKFLPHIYLDSHSDSKFIGPRKTYHQSQKLTLEGDFNTYFQAFVKPKFQTLALSILSPDVMQTIIQSGHRYDVEISGQKLRIIAHETIKHSEAAETLMLPVILKILEEIEHRTKSWTHKDEVKSYDSALISAHDRSLKIGSTYIRLEYIIILTLSVLPALVCYTIAIYWRQKHIEDWFVFFALGILFFPIVFIYILSSAKKYK